MPPKTSTEEVACSVLSSGPEHQPSLFRTSQRILAAVGIMMFVSACSSSMSGNLGRVGASTSSIIIPEPQIADASEGSYSKNIIPVPRGNLDFSEAADADYLNSLLRSLPWN